MTSLARRWSRRTAAARVLPRAAAVSLTSALAVLLFAGPALAATTIPLHEDHKNTKAADFQQECKADGMTPEVPGQDGWHFVVPGNDVTFLSLTLTFENNEGEEVVKNIPGDGIITGGGKSAGKHAVIYTPEGWTLLDGSAEIEGESATGDFVLSHTCAAPDETPSPTPTRTKTKSPSPTASASPSEEPSEEPSETPSMAPSSPVPAPGDGGGLPVTGLALTGLIITGVGMVGAGVAMRALRRKNEDTPGETEDGDAPTDV